MKIEKFHIYLATLDPPFGTEPGKTRPVVVVQTDSLNNVHRSTIICPLTTKVKDAYPLRVYISSQESSLPVDSDIMVDQIRAIDNHRFKKHVGRLNRRQTELLLRNLKIVVLE